MDSTTRQDDTRLMAYCAGKLTDSGPEATALYTMLRDRLRDYGVEVYLPSEHTGPGTKSRHPLNETSESVCLLDILRVAFTDFVIAMLNGASTGTGMELVTAQNWMVPLFVFHDRDLKPEEKVSRMALGLPGILRFSVTGSIVPGNAATKVFLYKESAELVTLIGGQVQHLRERLHEARRMKRALDEAWRELDLGALLKERMKERGMRDGDLALQLGASIEMVEFLTMDHAAFRKLFQPEYDTLKKGGHEDLLIDLDAVSVLRYVNPTTLQLGMLSRLLEVDLFGVIGKATCIDAEPILIPRDLQDSYHELLKVANGVSRKVIDVLIIEEVGHFKRNQILNGSANLYRPPRRRSGKQESRNWTEGHVDSLSAHRDSLIVSRFLNRHAEAISPTEAIVKHLRQWNRELGFWKSLPVNVSGLLQPAGIKELRRVAGLPVRARLTPVSAEGAADEFVVEVRTGLSHESERFALAHEISHTFFRRGVAIAEFPTKTDSHEERLCDIGAAEMLIPRHKLAPLLKRISAIQLEDLIHLAAEFEVSLPCMMHRIAEFRGDEFGFMLHKVERRSGGDATVVPVTGVFGKCRIRLDDPKNSQVMAAFESQKKTDVTYQKFQVNDRRAALYAASAPLPSESVSGDVVTIIYRKEHPSSDARSVESALPLFKDSALPTLRISRERYVCLECRNTLFTKMGTGVAPCSCRKGTVLDPAADRKEALLIQFEPEKR